MVIKVTAFLLIPLNYLRSDLRLHKSRHAFSSDKVGLIVSLLFVLGISLLGCARTQVEQDRQNLVNKPLTAVATTTIVGDVVKNIAGEHVEVQVLIPPGVDEHSFQYAPEDVIKIADADIVFMNGAGLESFMKPLLENLGNDVTLISVSDGIDLQQAVGDLPDSHPEEELSEDGDPHVWMDPNLVKIWTENIADSLSQLAPQYAGEFQTNAAAYQRQLVQLDVWIREQIAQVSEADRLLVTDHQVFTYFARQYGFEQVGAVIPAYSTVAAPSARELTALEDAIRQLGVKAVLVGNTVNPSLAQRVAEDTGIRLVPIYTGSLTDGPPAGTYLDYMRSNVRAIVEALK